MALVNNNIFYKMKNLLFTIIVLVSSVSVNAQNINRNPALKAQELITALKADHRELKFIGLHVSPLSGDTTNIIIASTIPTKIGNKSSPGDMEVVNKGVLRLKTQMTAETYEVCLPIATSAKMPLGMVVIQIAFADATSIVDALQKGLNIRDDLQKKIKDKAILFTAN